MHSLSIGRPVLKPKCLHSCSPPILAAISPAPRHRYFSLPLCHGTSGGGEAQPQASTVAKLMDLMLMEDQLHDEKIALVRGRRKIELELRRLVNRVAEWDKHLRKMNSPPSSPPSSPSSPQPTANAMRIPAVPLDQLLRATAT